tara:strand:+ start:37 stop:273 length:237 start_codon:yes stop_codon:yes gene_type:complete
MEMKQNTIIVFPNDKEGNEKRPDFTGKILWNGEEINVSLWKNTSKAGKPYLSGQVQKPYNGAVTSDVNQSTESADVPF